jgi:hypothetical protein
MPVLLASLREVLLGLLRVITLAPLGRMLAVSRRHCSLRVRVPSLVLLIVVLLHLRRRACLTSLRRVAIIVLLLLRGVILIVLLLRLQRLLLAGIDRRHRVHGTVV